MSELTIVQINDTHGYLQPHQELFWAGDHACYQPAGGYARIATILQQIRQEKPGQVLVFDCGDTFHGTYAAVQTQGAALIPILNTLKLDAMTAHWEFAYGPERFKQLTEQLSYPMLAINCYDAKTGDLIFEPYTIRETNDVRIGIIGIAATIVDKVMPASFSKGIYFTLGNEELESYVTKLRQEEKVDLVVVISHLGFPQEMKLAREVDGIDVLLSAHTHNRLYAPALVNDTILIQSGCHGSFLGQLDLEIENRRVIDYTHKLTTVDHKVEPDSEIQHLVDQALAPYSHLDEVVGETATALHRYTVLEATMDNLLLQSLLDLTGAQMAFSNGWRYGAPVPPGTVTVKDLWNLIPVNPPVSTCQLTGDELWRMLEQDLQHTFARDPYNQMGGYVKRCLGLYLYFKVENPYGHRIQQLFVGNEPVQPDRVFDVTFVTTQGVPAQYGSNRQHLDVKAIEALQRYLEQHSPVEAGLRGTVVAI